MSFENIYYLLLPLFLLPVYILFSKYSSNRYEILKFFTVKGLYEAQDISKSIRIGKRNFVLFSMVIILLSLALAGPRFNDSLSIIQADECVLLIDASTSMNALDLGKSRLDIGKDIARKLIQSQSGEISLAAFTEDCYLLDYSSNTKSSLLQSIGGIRPENFSDQGSNIEKALEKSVDFFSNQAISKKRIILISDGEFHSTVSDSTLIKIKQKNISLDCIIIGTSDGAIIRTADGKKVRTRATTRVCRQLIETGNGNLIEISKANSATTKLFASESLSKLDTVHFFSLQNVFILLAIAILLLIWKF